MRVVKTPLDVRRAVADARTHGRTIGFVPTMGALHDGHASLFARALADNHFVVASIFVNPMQFNDPSDLAGYPKTEANDEAICRVAGVDLVFRPDNDTIYPEGFDTRVVPGSVARPFEGEHRIGHFDGVATVVLKLLNLVGPDVAYFGRKDFQQLAVIRRMARDLNLGVSIIGCPTVREADGLAMSSRNVKLSSDARTEAACLSRALSIALDRLRAGDSIAEARAAGRRAMSTIPDADVDYFEIVDRNSLGPVSEDMVQQAVVLVAATVGGVRLIDNMQYDEGDLT